MEQETGYETHNPHQPKTLFEKYHPQVDLSKLTVEQKMEIEQKVQEIITMI